VTEAIAREFEVSYPHIDVRAKLQRMRTWSLSNPGKLKTARGMLRFINNWLARDNDKLVVDVHSRKLSAVEHNQLLLEKICAEERTRKLEVKNGK
jgi:hypothetical protein